MFGAIFLPIGVVLAAIDWFVMKEWTIRTTGFVAMALAGGVVATLREELVIDKRRRVVELGWGFIRPCFRSSHPLDAFECVAVTLVEHVVQTKNGRSTITLFVVQLRRRAELAGTVQDVELKQYRYEEISSALAFARSLGGMLDMPVKEELHGREDTRRGGA